MLKAVILVGGDRKGKFEGPLIASESALLIWQQ